MPQERAELITIERATRCFCASRLGVVDETEVRSRRKLMALPFEGFLEAWVRLTHIVPLPRAAKLATIVRMAVTGALPKKAEQPRRRSSTRRHPHVTCRRITVSYCCIQ